MKLKFLRGEKTKRSGKMANVRSMFFKLLKDHLPSIADHGSIKKKQYAHSEVSTLKTGKLETAITS